MVVSLDDDDWDEDEDGDGDDDDDMLVCLLTSNPPLTTTPFRGFMAESGESTSSAPTDSTIDSDWWWRF